MRILLSLLMFSLILAFANADTTVKVVSKIRHNMNIVKGTK